MQGLLHAMRSEAARLDRLAADPRMGIITSYDPKTHRAKAKYMPEDAMQDAVAESGWLPIATPLVGSGFGVYSPPSPGEQVYIIHLEHSQGGGIIVGRVNSQDAPPPEVPAGEIWMVHKSGTVLKLLNSGEMLMQHKDDKGTKLQLNDNGEMTATHESGTKFQFLQSSEFVATHKDGSKIQLNDDGQITVTHQSGTKLQFMSDGVLLATSQSGSYLMMAADGSVSAQASQFTMTGNLSVIGTLFVSGDIGSNSSISALGNVSDGNGSLDRLRTNYNPHTHTDSRGGNTSPTLEPDHQ